MNKRKIAVMLALAILAAPVAQVKGLNVKENAPIVTKQVIKDKVNIKAEVNRLGIEGSITKLIKEKNKATVIIKGKSLTEQGYNEVKLIINSGTRIVDENNKKISYNDLEEGMVVKAYFPKKVTKSNPPQAVAKEIIITSKKENQIEQSIAEGNIVGINKNKNGIMALVQAKDTPNPINGQINLLISDKTEIVSEEDGKKLTLDDIKDGMKIRAYYGPAVTMSIPPMGYAKKVVILKEQQKELKEIECDVIDILNFNGGVISYVKAEDKSFLTFISKYTQITNKDGKKLSFADIKKGSNIKVLFDERNSNFVLKSYIPNICIAEKIVVLEENQQKSIGTVGIIKGISDVKGGTSIFVDGKRIDKKGFDKVRLNISEETKIINGEDGSKLKLEDLEEGMKVKAYYGHRMTRSLPPIGTAQKIVVIGQESEDEKEYPFIVKYLEKRDNGYIDVLCGDLMHRINIEKVEEDLEDIEKGSMVEIDMEIIDGIKVAKSIKIYENENPDIKFDTMGRRLYDIKGKFFRYSDDKYVEIMQDDMILRFYCPSFDKKIEKNSLVSIEYVREGSVLVVHSIEGEV